MKCKQISIALGFDGDLNNKIKSSWKILNKEFNINFLSQNSCKPHISLLAGKIKENNLTEIILSLKNLKLKKFKIKSPGSAIFINNKPNLFIRWETNLSMRKYRQVIRNDLKKFFVKENIYTKDNLWIPRSAVAYRDISFLFKKHTVEASYILLIDYSKNKEIIKSKIKLI